MHVLILLLLLLHDMAHFLHLTLLFFGSLSLIFTLRIFLSLTLSPSMFFSILHFSFKYSSVSPPLLPDRFLSPDSFPRLSATSLSVLCAPQKLSLLPQLLLYLPLLFVLIIFSILFCCLLFLCNFF